MLIACATPWAEVFVARAHALKTIVGRFTALKISLVLRPGTVMATWFVGWVNANKIIATDFAENIELLTALIDELDARCFAACRREEHRKIGFQVANEVDRPEIRVAREFCHGVMVVG